MELYGELGGGGEKQHTPIESDDTLQSRQIVKLLFAVSEGEIESVDDILLNNVSIDNYSANWEWRSGVATQTVIPGFNNTESPAPGFAPVTVSAGIDYFVGVPYNASACRITLSLAQLKFINDKNDVLGYAVKFQVYTRPSTTDLWTLIATINKRGKASSRYSWDTRISAPDGVTVASNWEIKLVRITPDDADIKHISPSSWDSAIAIIESDLAYPDTALVAITLTDAKQFGGQIPEVKFKIKGIKVKIPTNYDAVNHLYDEVIPWDGSLTENLFYFTANPAWHIYNVLNNSRYALGITKSDIDVVSLYNLSKYADELVDDGHGGQERRYDLNNQFYTRENAPTFLTYLLNICNANFTTNEFGQLSIMFDRPGQAITKQVTNANVIDGQFSYSSSDLETRYNLVNVTYNRKQFNGSTDTATEVENSLVSRYGLQTSDIVLPGCTSEAQAVRKARWAIYTNAFLPNQITYEVLFSGMIYHVGELVKVFDVDNQGSNQAGLIKSFSDDGFNTTLMLDRSVDLAAETYLVSFLAEDGITEKVKTVIQTDITTATISFVGVDLPAVNSVFILSGTVVPKNYKVVKISHADSRYQISCIEHSEDKYTYIDQGIVLDNPSGDFLNISEFLTPAVDSITVVENFSGNGVTQNSALEVSWVWDKSAVNYAADFRSVWKRDNQQSQLVNEIVGNTYDIIDPVPGIYEVTVWAINPFTGISSTPLVQTYDFRTVASTSSLQPPVNIFVTGTSGLVFDSPDVNISFGYDPANDNVSDSLKDYVIEVWDSTTTDLKATYTVSPDAVKNGTFTFPYSENIARFGTATRTFNFKLFSRDVMGDLSLPAIVQVTNNVPGLSSFTLTSGTEATYIDIAPPADLDLAGFIIYRSETDGFTPAPGDIIYRGADNYLAISGESGKQYFFRVAAYDTFSETGLLIAPQQSTSLLSTSVDTWVFEGLLFKPNDPASDSVSWTAGSASKNGAASIAISAGNAAWTASTLFLYYDGSSGTLSATDNLSLAVSGVQVLATYKGGTDLTVGNGKAFVDGGLLLAGTVGASQLVVGSAVITGSAQLASAIIDTAHIKDAQITTAKIADAQITNAKIGDTIQSDSFSNITFNGWQINKLGDILSYGSFELRDNSNDVVMSASGLNGAFIDDLTVNTINIANDATSSSVIVEVANVTTINHTSNTIETTLVNTSFTSFGGITTISAGFFGEPVFIDWAGTTYQSQDMLLYLELIIDGVLVAREEMTPPEIVDGTTTITSDNRNFGKINEVKQYSAGSHTAVLKAYNKKVSYQLSAPKISFFEAKK